jgi:anti-sigma factor RsiW
MNVNWIWNRCGRWRRGISLRAAGLLAEEERVAIDTHLSKCAACQRHYQALATVCRFLDSVGGRLPPAEPTAALRARWTKAVKAEARPQTITVADSRRWWDWWLASNRPAWAGLAVVWLLIFFFHFTAPDLPQATHRSVAAAPKELLVALKTKLNRSSVLQEPVEPPSAQPSKPTPQPPRSDGRRDRMAG